MFKKLSVEEQRIIDPLLASIARSHLEQMKNFWGNPEVFKDPYRIWKEDNPIVIYPYLAKELWIDYEDFVPFEYRWLWYVVSWKLNP